MLEKDRVDDEAEEWIYRRECVSFFLISREGVVGWGR